MPESCVRCKAALSRDEIGLHKKLVNRGSTEYLCIKCLSADFKIPEEKLRELIEHYRRMGCTLFC